MLSCTRPPFLVPWCGGQGRLTISPSGNLLSKSDVLYNHSKSGALFVFQSLSGGIMQPLHKCIIDVTGVGLSSQHVLQIGAMGL